MRFARGVGQVWTPDHLAPLRTTVRQHHKAQLQVVHAALNQRFEQPNADWMGVFRAAAEMAVSGKLKGLWYAQIPWMFSDQESRVIVFAPDVVRNRRLYYYNRTYPIWALASLLLPALLRFAIEGTLAAAFSGFIVGGLARVFVANQAAWCVGSVSHSDRFVAVRDQ